MYFPYFSKETVLGVTLILPDDKVLSDTAEAIKFSVDEDAIVNSGEAPYDWIRLIFSSILALFSGPIKFQEKNILIYGKCQENINLIQGTDALAAVNLTFEDKIQTSTIPYSGSEIDRSAKVFLENILRNIEFETFLPKLFSETLTEDSLSLGRWLEACGGAASIEENVLSFSNTVSINKKMFIDVSRVSDNDQINKNTYLTENAFGTVGLDITIGKIPKLKFNFTGLPVLPFQESRITPNFVAQKINIFNTLRKNKVKSLLLGNLESKELRNFCFYRLQTENLFGFDLNFLQVSCEESIVKNVTNPVVVLSILLTAGETENLLVENSVGKEFDLEISFEESGKTFSVKFTELCLMEYKKDTIAGYIGYNLGFLNTGFSILSFT